MSADTMTITLSEMERWYVSQALAQFVNVAIDVPEVDLEEVQELHSRFLAPSDIAA